MRAPDHYTPGLGIEKQCTRCREWWPADGEFFTSGSGRYGLHSWCRACQTEARRDANGTGAARAGGACEPGALPPRGATER